MAVVTFSPVEGEMKVDSEGQYVSLESYLILEKLPETLKEQDTVLVNVKEKTEQEQTKKAWPSVVIYFDEVDADLYNYLIEMAAREYRTPEQQLLYILDCLRSADNR